MLDCSSSITGGCDHEACKAEANLSRKSVRLSLRDSFSLSGDSQNEDRVGQIGTTAWVIDGATDLLEVPILPGPSDATWFALTR